MSPSWPGTGGSSRGAAHRCCKASTTSVLGPGCSRIDGATVHVRTAQRVAGDASGLGGELGRSLGKLRRARCCELGQKGEEGLKGIRPQGMGWRDSRVYLSGVWGNWGHGEQHRNIR